MFDSGPQPKSASLHTLQSKAPHIETLRENGEAIADAVAAYMLVHATTHYHEVVRKRGTFDVLDEGDCSRAVKEIVHKRYNNPLPYINDLSRCTRLLDVLDRSSARITGPGAGKIPVLRLSLSLEWKLPKDHDNYPGEYKEIYKRVIILTTREGILQACHDGHAKEWTISTCRTDVDRLTGSTRVIAPTYSGLTWGDLNSWGIDYVLGCSRFHPDDSGYISGTRATDHDDQSPVLSARSG